MAVQENGQISFSFIGLRELLNSFEELEGGTPGSAAKEASVYQLVDHLGELATPVLMRKLVGGSQSGRWASLLLLRLGQDTGLRKKICVALREHLGSASLSDLLKLRALDLLSQLGERADDLPTLQCAEQSAEFSLVELASCISSPAQLARAVDILIGDLPGAELVEFVEDMARHQPDAARRVLNELHLRDDLEVTTCSQLQTVSLEIAGQEVALSEPRPRRPGLRLAKHADGREAIVSYARINSQSPARYRALCMDISAREGLVACSYLDTVTRSEVDRQILKPLLEEGFELTPLAPGEAMQRATVAMRLRSTRGLAMPRSYYLGRDLLNLTDEHLAKRWASQAGLAELLARGTDLLRRGQANAAKDLLATYATHHPDDAEGMATLGSCLLALGDVAGARAHLARAAWLSPTIGRYHWNQAALAHKEGRLGDCFLALSEYLGCLDAVDSQQRRVARDFIAEYGRQRAVQTPRELAVRDVPQARGRYLSSRQKRE